MDFEDDVNQESKSTLQKNIEFKRDFGMTHAELSEYLENHDRKAKARYEQSIIDQTGHPNGFHHDAAHDIHINWVKIAECEAEGYEWPTMPWLPAPIERVGKTHRELNWMAYNRREQLRNAERG